MTRSRNHLLGVVAFVMLGLILSVTARQGSPTVSNNQGPRLHCNSQLISESALLSGLAPGAVFPFIDSTPNSIVSAHIAITDATTTCAAGAASPANMQILAGQAGVQLVPVIQAPTNTGIGTATQCVFHVTVTPGIGGVPETVTDIVVVNTNTSAALTGVNTITASAEVCVQHRPPGHFK